MACLGLADGRSAGEVDGAWLVSYDPAGHDGLGAAVWSRDPAEAARFTAEEWTALSAAAPASIPRPDGSAEPGYCDDQPDGVPRPGPAGLPSMDAGA